MEIELKEIERQIQNCDHEYGETQYYPETEKAPYGSKMEKRDRWSQTCKNVFTKGIL